MDDMQKVCDKNQMVSWQKVLPHLRKTFRVSHLAALAVGLAIGNWATLESAIKLGSKHYQHGIEHGYKSALSINPPSAELEYTCAGLWFSTQEKNK
jgi:hypothetical protein